MRVGRIIGLSAIVAAIAAAALLSVRNWEGVGEMVTYASNGDPVLIGVALVIGLIVGFTLGWIWKEHGDPL
jgi:ABC-type xylose transport system permease subunit